MSWFTELLLGSQGEAAHLNADVFDMLLSFTEFGRFHFYDIYKITYRDE